MYPTLRPPALVKNNGPQKQSTNPRILKETFRGRMTGTRENERGSETECAIYKYEIVRETT